jgi:Protein of unknown function (DUF1593)
MSKTIFFFILFVSFSQNLFSKSLQKPRTIVTTDGEIDDVDSFIRMLLYSNEFNLEGLVYSSSMWHYKGDGKGTKMVSEMAMTKQMYGEKTDLRWPGVNWMQDLIGAYAKVYPNLISNAKGYPTANYLRSLIKVGNIEFEGEMDHNTEGSDFIKAKLLDSNPEPIYLQVWGGTNTIARALKSIEDDYKNTKMWDEIYKKVCKKAIIYAILDQDATYKKYVAVNWPDVKVYYNSFQFGCFAYPWKRLVPSEFQPYLEGKFMAQNIIQNHGPLLKMYYSYGDGQKQPGDDEHIHGDITKIEKGQWGSFKPYDFISEGDSPAYLHLLNVGLGNLENPNFGGWGGRLSQSKTDPNRWEDGPESADYNPFTAKMDNSFPQTRWVDVIQNDFAARADWCILPFVKTNHEPKIVVKNGLKRIVMPNEKVKILVGAIDPDKNKVNITFWQYREAGTSKEIAEIKPIKNGSAEILIPQNLQKGETIHIIAEGRDNGVPALTRYQRIILIGK